VRRPPRLRERRQRNRPRPRPPKLDAREAVLDRRRDRLAQPRDVLGIPVGIRIRDRLTNPREDGGLELRTTRTQPLDEPGTNPLQRSHRDHARFKLQRRGGQTDAWAMSLSACGSGERTPAPAAGGAAGADAPR
jgi:hypothetical protein